MKPLTGTSKPNPDSRQYHGGSLSVRRGLPASLTFMAPLAKPQTAARELGARGSRRGVASSDPAAELTATAAAVVAAVPAWWAARARAAGLDDQWLDVEQAIDALPPCPVPSRPPLEQEWGPLTGEEVGAAGLVRDPACGAGALLLPALREHLRGSHSVDPRLLLAGLPNVIEGWDLDPAAVWIANVVMAAELLPLLASVPLERRRPLPALAHVGDGLSPDREQAAIVVMNPPYGRVHLSAADQKRFADVLYGHANLYAVFMAAAVEQAQTSTGIVAALVPTSWTAGKYFGPLRNRLSKDVRLASVRFVEQRSGVFTSVLQETCLALFTRRRVRRTTVSSTAGDRVTPIATVDNPARTGYMAAPTPL